MSSYKTDHKLGESVTLILVHMTNGDLRKMIHCLYRMFPFVTHHVVNGIGMTNVIETFTQKLYWSRDKSG